MFKNTAKINEYCKNEMIKRYLYLYQNSGFILGLYAEKLTNGIVYFDKLSPELLEKIENLTLSPEIMEKTSGYNFIEAMKKDLILTKVSHHGLKIIEENNHNVHLPAINIDTFKIFKELYEYIHFQQCDEINREKKLQVIDEYLRIARFNFDEKNWESGYFINVKELGKYIGSVQKRNTLDKQSRKKDDAGVKNNFFINAFSNTSIFKNRDNAIRFSENEKRRIKEKTKLIN